LKRVRCLEKEKREKENEISNTLILISINSNTKTDWKTTNGEMALKLVDLGSCEGDGPVLAVRVRYWNGNMIASKVFKN